jgi:hypothetical protein
MWPGQVLSDSRPPALALLAAPPLRRAFDASLRRATDVVSSAPWSLLAGEWDHASLAAAFGTMAMAPPCFLPHHPHCRHALSLPSLLDRRWKQFHSTGHLSRCLGSPWVVLSQRRSRSPTYHS